jgi:hypothetical protein
MIPRRIEVGPPYGFQASVQYTKRRRMIRVAVRLRGIIGPDDDEDGADIPLGDFLRALGITAADCRRALGDGGP